MNRTLKASETKKRADSGHRRRTYTPNQRPTLQPPPFPAPHLGDRGELGGLLSAVAQQAEGAKGVRREGASGGLLLVDLVGEPRGFRLARVVRRLVERCARVELKGARAWS